jgi:hypothetical protein
MNEVQQKGGDMELSALGLFEMFKISAAICEFCKYLSGIVQYF